MLAGVVGRDVRRGGWLEDGWRERGNATEVVVLNCDCEELDVVSAFQLCNRVWQ